MSPLLDLKEAGRLLSISPWTVRAYIKTGKLMPVRLGRRVLFEEEELQRFIGEAKSHSHGSEDSNSINDVSHQGKDNQCSSLNEASKLTGLFHAGTFHPATLKNGRFVRIGHAKQRVSNF